MKQITRFKYTVKKSTGVYSTFYDIRRINVKNPQDDVSVGIYTLKSFADALCSSYNKSCTIQI